MLSYAIAVSFKTGINSAFQTPINAYVGNKVKLLIISQRITARQWQHEENLTQRGAHTFKIARMNL